MKRKILIIAPLFFPVFFSCDSGMSTPMSTYDEETGIYDPGGDYTLVWSDEFDGPGIDTSVWIYETESTGWSQSWNNEWQVYTDSGTGGSNAYIEDGALVIKAEMTGSVHAEDSYTSARMVTKDTKTWQYGKIAGRIALPYGQGIWPAFWMLGEEGSWPSSGEIDIMEMIGGTTGSDNQVYGTLHWGDSSGNHQSSGNSRFINHPQEYHIYELEWTSSRIRIGVDGEAYFTASLSDDMSEFRQPFYILLNLAVGGTWPEYPDSTTVFPQYLKIDWIRVYQ